MIEHKPLRGSSWGYNPWSGRSAARNRIVPNYTSNVIGFRVMLIDHPPHQETKDRD